MHGNVMQYIWKRTCNSAPPTQTWNHQPPLVVTSLKGGPAPSSHAGLLPLMLISRISSKNTLKWFVLRVENSFTLLISSAPHTQTAVENVFLPRKVNVPGFMIQSESNIFVQNKMHFQSTPYEEAFMSWLPCRDGGLGEDDLCENDGR